MKISVCMATYNGEKYIENQLESILTQVSSNDEIIISDDGSNDRTLEIIEKIQKNTNKKIIIINGPQKGVIKNFENAILKSSNDIIFLSDQDDIWSKTKVSEVKKIFSLNEDITLVIHDAKLINENGEIIGKKSKFKKGLIKNIIKNSYIGCCMSFKKSKYILPFPKNIPMHDSWIGLINEKKGKVYHLEKELFCYRIHGENYTLKNKRSLKNKIKDRINLIRNVLLRGEK